MPEGNSAAQLRREAAKARALANNAFAEEERRALLEVAATLAREAGVIERRLAIRKVVAARQARILKPSTVGPKF